MDKVDVANQRVLEIENGLSSVELYLEPEYHRYLRGEITALWEEIHDLKARIKKSWGKMNEEYHKGEWCPYAERTGRQPTLCQEGYFSGCEIWLDYQKLQECPLGLDKIHCHDCNFWRDGKCAHNEIMKETEGG